MKSGKMMGAAVLRRFCGGCELAEPPHQIVSPHQRLAAVAAVPAAVVAVVARKPLKTLVRRFAAVAPPPPPLRGGSGSRGGYPWVWCIPLPATGWPTGNEARHKEAFPRQKRNVSPQVVGARPLRARPPPPAPTEALSSTRARRDGCAWGGGAESPHRPVCVTECPRNLLCVQNQGEQ